MVQDFVIKDDINIGSLLAAHKEFKHAIQVAKSDLEKAGAIKLFEITFELSWKTMKRILAARGKDVHSPKPIIREAGLEKLIEDTEVWLQFVDERNETVHTYDRKKANEIFLELEEFNIQVEIFISNLKKLKK